MQPRRGLSPPKRPPRPGTDPRADAFDTAFGVQSQRPASNTFAKVSEAERRRILNGNAFLQEQQRRAALTQTALHPAFRSTVEESNNYNADEPIEPVALTLLGPLVPRLGSLQSALEPPAGDSSNKVRAAPFRLPSDVSQYTQPTHRAKIEADHERRQHVAGGHLDQPGPGTSTWSSSSVEQASDEDEDRQGPPQSERLKHIAFASNQPAKTPKTSFLKKFHMPRIMAGAHHVDKHDSGTHARSGSVARMPVKAVAVLESIPPTRSASKRNQLDGVLLRSPSITSRFRARKSLTSDCPVAEESQQMQTPSGMPTESDHAAQPVKRGLSITKFKNPFVHTPQKQTASKNEADRNKSLPPSPAVDSPPAAVPSKGRQSALYTHQETDIGKDARRRSLLEPSSTFEGAQPRVARRDVHVGVPGLVTKPSTNSMHGIVDSAKMHPDLLQKLDTDLAHDFLAGFDISQQTRKQPSRKSLEDNCRLNAVINMPLPPRTSSNAHVSEPVRSGVMSQGQHESRKGSVPSLSSMDVGIKLDMPTHQPAPPHTTLGERGVGQELGLVEGLRSHGNVLDVSKKLISNEHDMNLSDRRRVRFDNGTAWQKDGDEDQRDEDEHDGDEHDDGDRGRTEFEGSARQYRSQSAVPAPLTYLKPETYRPQEQAKKVKNGSQTDNEVWEQRRFLFDNPAGTPGSLSAHDVADMHGSSVIAPDLGSRQILITLEEFYAESVEINRLQVKLLNTEEETRKVKEEVQRLTFELSRVRGELARLRGEV